MAFEGANMGSHFSAIRYNGNTRFITELEVHQSASPNNFVLSPGDDNLLIGRIGPSNRIKLVEYFKERGLRCSISAIFYFWCQTQPRLV